MSQKRLSLLKPSTRAMIREARRAPNYSFWDWLHGYVYGRWIYFYISFGIGEHPLAKRVWPIAGRVAQLFKRFTPARPPDSSKTLGFADGYHGKVMPVESAKRLVSVQQNISLTNLEQVIPYPRARDIVLQNPDHIVVLDCPCRMARENPCLPLDVCLVVGEPFAGFVLEHHPDRARAITSAEAADILQAEHERGHVQHAFFKDAMLGRFYAICNCCSCCCGAMGAHRNGIPMLSSSGFVAVVDDINCIGCGECEEYCQFGAINVENGGVAVIAAEQCMGCGVCASHCINEAITLAHDPSRGEPLEIQKLMVESVVG
jgi:Pyruvate/2-oxoacid:ferredoxin oxidoreductase delta subunit